MASSLSSRMAVPAQAGSAQAAPAGQGEGCQAGDEIGGNASTQNPSRDENDGSNAQPNFFGGIT